MRALVTMWLMIILAGCTGHAGGTQAAPPEPTPHPTREPALASSVLMHRRNDDTGQSEIRAVDPATGETVAGFTPVGLGSDDVSAHAVSADGTRLAVVKSRSRVSEPSAGGTSYRPSGDVLHLIELRMQRVVTATLSGDGWVNLLIFRPDASQLALVENMPGASMLTIFDAATGTRVAKRRVEFRPSLLTYAENGMTLVLYGQDRGVPAGIGKPAPPQVMLLDATTLEPLWERSLETVLSGHWCLEQCTQQHGQQLFTEWRPAVVPARDGRRLYIVHADEDRLTTVEFDSGVVRSMLVREEQSWLDRLLGVGVAHAKGVPAGATKQAVLSHDGRRLYVVAHTRSAASAGGNDNGSIESDITVRSIDVLTGRLHAHRDVEVIHPYVRIDGVLVSPDGTHLFVNGWDAGERWTEILDAQSLERVTRLADWQVVLMRRLDGQPLVMARQWRDDRHAQRAEFALLDLHTFDLGDAWAVSNISLLTP